MQRFRIGAVTDIFSPDVGIAATAMRELGMRGAELRTINGSNVLDAFETTLVEIPETAEP